MDLIISVDFYVTSDSQKDAYLLIEALANNSKIEYKITGIEAV